MRSRGRPYRSARRILPPETASRADDQIDRALHEDRDPRLGPHAQGTEVPRQAVGPAVQLAVGHLLPLAGDGHGSGSTVGLLLDPGRERADEGVAGGGRIPGAELEDLLGGEEAQLAEAALGPLDCGEQRGAVVESVGTRRLHAGAVEISRSGIVYP